MDPLFQQISKAIEGIPVELFDTNFGFPGQELALGAVELNPHAVVWLEGVDEYNCRVRLTDGKTYRINNERARKGA